MSGLRCREIEARDTTAVVKLLTKGFRADRPRAYWENAIRILSEHPVPPGLPKYGYLLENAGVPVGVLLSIFSSVPADDANELRCNVSSWYVEPGFRSYAPLLASRALKHKDVTYSNLSPAPHTWPTLAAQGYKPFSSGLFVSFSWLSGSVAGSHVKAIAPGTSADETLSSFEVQLLRDHAQYGCLSLICELNGRRFPFVFRVGLKFGVIRRAHLIYCRDLTDFVQFSGPIGHYLGRRLIPLISIDSNGPIPRLVGIYRDGRPKFYKGPDRMRLGDVTYSELAMFG